MNANYQPEWHRKFNSYGLAVVIILMGVFWLARNLGYISSEILHIVISWQMILILLGVSSLVKRKFSSAFVLLAVGTFFILPKILGPEAGALRQYWPVLIIFAGIAMLFKKHDRHKSCQKYSRIEGSSQNGFVASDVSFGNAQHIVLDPVFKGADLDVAFGNIVLDLRRTKLEGEQTLIDVDCSFGSVELYIPSTWNVQIEVDAIIGETKDKRLQTLDMDNEHKLIIRGDVSFGSIQLKN